jgi:threonine/homoserine/homoserine lactone efflux protein
MLPFVEGLIAGYGIAIPVGAVAILIVGVGMKAGFRLGFVAGAGAASADFLYAVLASVAGSAMITLLRPVSQVLRIVSGLVLIGMAVFAIWRGLQRVGAAQSTAQATGALSTYSKFLGITLINPLTVVYFTALILGRDPAAQLGFAGQVMYALGAGISSLSWQTLLAALGGTLRNRLSQRFQQWATVLGNLLVLGLGVRVIVLAVG